MPYGCRAPAEGGGVGGGKGEGRWVARWVFLFSFVLARKASFLNLLWSSTENLSSLVVVTVESDRFPTMEVVFSGLVAMTGRVVLISTLGGRMLGSMASSSLKTVQ